MCPFQLLQLFSRFSSIYPWHSPHFNLGFHTGMGIPTVFPKWVTWVQVQFWILAHHAHCVPVPWCHGYLWVNYVIMVSPFYNYSYLYFNILSSSWKCTKKWLEFETPTNTTIYHVCFYSTSHSINCKHVAFGPLPMGLREGLRARKEGKMGVGRD